MVRILKWERREKPTQEDFEEMFSKRELDYYSFSNNKGHHYEKHEHDYSKFLAVTKGKMKWTVDGEEHILEAGDAVAMPKNTLHEVTVLEDCECWEGHF